MRYEKPATTVEAQIGLLSERGLNIPDQARAIRHMRAIGYYRLSAYWLMFEQPAPPGLTRSRRFIEGVAWDDVIGLYAFDRRLRVLVMEAVERVEIAVRSAKYHTPYLPPLWSACELLSLGQLSVLFATTRDQKVRTQAAKDVGLPSKDVLDSVLQVVSLTRNVCAHHSRLWNRRFVKRLPVIKRFRDDLVLEQGQPVNLLYNTLAVLLRMLEAQGGDAAFVTNLKTHLETVSEDQRRAMGVPDDWRTRPIWSGT